MRFLMGSFTLKARCRRTLPPVTHTRTMNLELLRFFVGANDDEAEDAIDDAERSVPD
ncbi:hypothetical protein RBSWK_02906 [Rhodopirellula baltica SWK14]|uniref:Uncharacterized protein n=1 Tax=Rhodopirellula baltica SWK14 TaxID=993516 RepID=L7CGU6_RHOBT|nr:hypothetical protein RBSWK_02906 [Rhodopirellula baltica SWK14]